MKTIHLISHTHWDREWYRTFQQFRLRLVHLVDGLLDILASDRDYKHFMLDGQTIVLDDYLLMRPEAESTLTRLIRSGRALIGPWHILPDMFLVSPEAHIRNLLAGDRNARRFGPKMNIGYMPDSFGHIGQMPQILQGFGIDNACLWRGLDDQPTEFWWQSPDGTRVLMLYLRDSYSNGASLNASNPAQFTEQIQQAADSLAPHSAADDLLIMFGTDHMEPPAETSKAIKAANKGLKGYRLVHSTLPKYLAAVKSKVAGQKSVPTVTGELRSSKRSHLLPGVLSTRMWIKQRNHASENLLEKWAEPFSTFASLTTDDRPQTIVRRPSSIVRQSWLLLLQNHPHDSICGCSIDQVHDEMLPRFDQVDQIGEEITRQSLEVLAAQVDTSHDTSSLATLVVFNPLSASRTDVVTAELTLPVGVSNFEIVDEAGNVIPHQSASGKTSELINVRIKRSELGGILGMVNDGRAANLAIQDMQFSRDGATLRVEAIFAENAEPNMDVWNRSVKAIDGYLADDTIEAFHIHARSPDSAEITFAAANVPALGWKTFYVRAKESVPAEIHVSPFMRLLAPLANIPAAQKLIERMSQPKVKPPYIIENDFLSVELTSDSTITVTDKTTGQTYRGLNRFVDSGDCGDEYNFSPPPSDLVADSAILRGVTLARGPVQQTLTFDLDLLTPASLASDRKSRSKEQVVTRITSRVTLTRGVPRADIHTCADNRAKDHRLRVHFPAPFTTDFANHDGHFEIVKRPIGLPPFDETWSEDPRPETYQSAFTSISDRQNTLTIANRGLPEVEALRTRKSERLPSSEGVEIALTLLRSVGWLSRDDFTSRRNHAGPLLETPKAQMIGEWEFDYSIIVEQVANLLPQQAGQIGNLSYRQAWNFESPLRATGTSLHAGTLPSSGSFVRVDNASFVVSAVKETENGKGWIVRGYNIGDEEIPVTITPWRRFAKAERANMAEETVTRLKVGRGGEVTVNARGHEVVTVKFS
ncbi:MAG: alpha-mannosidase [Chloroflexota bacterium]